MKKVVVITTGGTIASSHEADADHTVANVKGEALLSSLHDRPQDVELQIDEFCNIGSFALDLPILFDLARRIEWHLKQEDVDGVVVTHGTDTMEETAFLADLIVDSEKPIVFTGAQRAADVADTDGPRNLGDAIRLAASERAHGLGAVILFEQDLHAARDVTKTHASRVDTFASAEHGKLGEIDGDNVIVFRIPALRKKYHVSRIETHVDLIKLVVGSDDRFLRFAAKDGARAIVLECFGRGNATPPVAEAIKDVVAAGIPVIITSRCSQGRVKPVYGNGGGRTVELAGGIFAGDLAGPKARILASVLLGLDLSQTEFANEIALLAGS